MTEIEKWLTDANKDSMPTPALQWMFDNNGFSLEKDLLDPKKWQAVGKTRGWWTVTPVGMFEFGGSPYAKGYEGRYEKYQAKQEWCYKMIVFMYYRADGLTIEEALTKLR